MSPAQRIADITAAIAAARAAATDGAQVDLDGLVAVVDAAMRDVQNAPLAERAALTTALLKLLHELDTLVTALARQQHGDVQQRAAAAYADAAKKQEDDER
jgi:hypothetical protein